MKFKTPPKIKEMLENTPCERKVAKEFSRELNSLIKIGVSKPPNRFWVQNISERIPPLVTELEYIVRVLMKLDISPTRGKRRK